MIHPIPFSQVKILDGFWAQKQEVNRKVTIPVSFDQNKKTGRIDALRLLWKPGMPNQPHIFWDSDVAKWVETASYSLHVFPDPELKKQLDEVVDLISKSQQPDGYLNSHYTVVEPQNRFTNLRDNHELYCAGHLIEAAVAHYQATNEKKLLDTMCRYADYIDSVFGPEDNKKHGYCGHEEIELALIKLYRVTNNKKYLNLAKYFVDERGQVPFYYQIEAEKRGAPTFPFQETIKRMEYYQSHMPLVEQKSMVGHAVRAGYLYSGAADVASETNDQELFSALEAIWKDAMLTKMYITGGIGSSRLNEGITEPYDLPNESAYCETCAAIAMLFWNHRMLQNECDRKYSDVVERILFNGSISGIALSGEKFFYENPLAITKKRRGFKREDWFGCACCPNNLSRLIASLGSYIYSEGQVSRDGTTVPTLFIHQYINSSTRFQVGDAFTDVSISSEYPWNGEIELKISPNKENLKFALKFRIPEWCNGFKIRFNNEILGDNLTSSLEKGYYTIDRKWNSNDELKLSFNMEVERIYAHPNVVSDTGRVALQRGPIVYCLEEIDNGADIDLFCLPPNAEFDPIFRNDLLGGVMVIMGSGWKLVNQKWENKLYDRNFSDLESVPFIAVPYFAWGNRGVGEMEVWIRELSRIVEN